MSPIRISERQFAPGLNVVAKEHEPELALPMRTDLGPADIPARSQLEQLYPMRDMNDLILDLLEPEISSHDMLRPGKFLSALNASPRELRHAAQKLPRAARALGKAASLMSDEIGRRSQVWLLQAALRQI